MRLLDLPKNKKISAKPPFALTKVAEHDFTQAQYELAQIGMPLLPVQSAKPVHPCCNLRSCLLVACFAIGSSKSVCIRYQAT
jgi:hypothetical protein